VKVMKLLSTILFLVSTEKELLYFQIIVFLGIIYYCSITSTISKTITLRLSITLSVTISPRPITISITI